MSFVYLNQAINSVNEAVNSYDPYSTTGSSSGTGAAGTATIEFKVTTKSKTDIDYSITGYDAESYEPISISETANDQKTDWTETVEVPYSDPSTNVYVSLNASTEDYKDEAKCEILVNGESVDTNGGSWAYCSWSGAVGK